MTDTLVKQDLPHWDMSPVFPSLDSTEFENAFGSIVSTINELRARFDERGVRRTQDAAVDQGVVSLFDDVLGTINDLQERLTRVRGFIYAFVTTDSSNDLAQSKQSELVIQQVELDKLEKRFTAWVGSLDVDVLLESSALARDHEFRVRRAREEASHQMTEAEEDLAASLSPSGQSGWSRLHGNVTSRLMVNVPMPDGTTQRLPMSAVRGLQGDADPAVREAAYRAELGAWPTVEVPLAASLNSVKGWQNTVNRRRGWSDSIEPALFASNVDRATLEAMQSACIESFPDFQRYLRAKAKLLGKDRLGWYDLPAPVGASGKEWNWDETANFIVEQFGTYSEKLANLAARAFLERWIDAEPREGKRDGGFCMGVQADESRALVNFNHHFGAVATVAHELGHAYHNLCLADRTPYQRRTPMPLAETASTFCENIVTEAMLAGASDDEKLGILEGGLQRDVNIVVNIHGRFLFEKALFEGREKRELSARELCEKMRDCQQQVVGDAMNPDQLHPYHWAVAPHYYGNVHYYNWPYTFGLLFGLGLYARYETEPDAFRGGYDELLSLTGMYDAADLAARFDMDVRSPDFWRSSLDVIRTQINEYERLAGA